MKVYLGPHVTPWRCRIHDDYMDKKYEYMWPRNYTPYENFLMVLEDAVQFVYDCTINVYLNRKERVEKVRIDGYDIWAMDHTLALIALPMLKKLRDAKHGVSYVDPEDVPHIGKGEELDNAWDSNAEARWVWTLDEMIWAFEQILDEDSHKNYYDPYEPGELIATQDKFSKYVAETMGRYNDEKYKVYNKRIDNGLLLFGKYLRALWD